MAFNLGDMCACLSILSKTNKKKQVNIHIISYRITQLSNYFCIPALVLSQIKLFKKEIEFKMWMFFNMIGYLELGMDKFCFCMK